MSRVADLFINQLSAEEKAETTTEHYAEIIGRFEEWLRAEHQLTLGKEDVGQINGEIMVEYYQVFHERQLKASTRNNYTVILKKFFSFLLGIGVISEDPTRVLHCIKPKADAVDGDEKEYSTEQLRALLSLLSDPKSSRNCLRDAAVVALMLGSGLRASEVCSLNVGDAHTIKSGTLTCKRKGHGYKTVEVAGFVWPYIDRYLWQRGKCQNDEPLFLSQKGYRMGRTALWKSLRTKQSMVGIPSGVHKFRHTFTSDVDRNPIGGAAVSRDLAGHKSVSITNTYLHSNHDERQQVVNSMGYADLLEN